MLSDAWRIISVIAYGTACTINVLSRAASRLPLLLLPPLHPLGSTSAQCLLIYDTASFSMASYDHCCDISVSVTLTISGQFWLEAKPWLWVCGTVLLSRNCCIVYCCYCLWRRRCDVVETRFITLAVLRCSRLSQAYCSDCHSDGDSPTPASLPPRPPRLVKVIFVSRSTSWL